MSRGGAPAGQGVGMGNPWYEASAQAQADQACRWCDSGS